MSSLPALIVIDVQQGFLDPVWGRTDNPRAEDNIRRLLSAWRRRHWPVVLVRHDSLTPDSPLAAHHGGNRFQEGIDGAHHLLVSKTVNSAFYGTPDLRTWLDSQGINSVVICGLTTNHCCESTARMAGNIGYDVSFVIDATRAFDQTHPSGDTIPAEQIVRATAANLDQEFATVTLTDDVLASMDTAGH